MLDHCLCVTWQFGFISNRSRCGNLFLVKETGFMHWTPKMAVLLVHRDLCNVVCHIWLALNLSLVSRCAETMGCIRRGGSKLWQLDVLHEKWFQLARLFSQVMSACLCTHVCFISTQPLLPLYPPFSLFSTSSFHWRTFVKSHAFYKTPCSFWV